MATERHEMNPKSYRGRLCPALHSWRLTHDQKFKPGKEDYVGLDTELSGRTVERYAQSPVFSTQCHKKEKKRKKERNEEEAKNEKKEFTNSLSCLTFGDGEKCECMGLCIPQCTYESQRAAWVLAFAFHFV
jgi:hypothetical protein